MIHRCLNLGLVLSQHVADDNYLGPVVGGPLNPLGGARRRGSDALLHLIVGGPLVNPYRHDGGALGDPDDAGALHLASGDHPRHRGPVAAVVALAIPPAQEIDPRSHRSLKMGVVRIHAGVDNGHDDALPLCHAPGLLHTDLLEHRWAGRQQGALSSLAVGDLGIDGRRAGLHLRGGGRGLLRCG